MYSYNQYLKQTNKLQFIKETVLEFQGTKVYNDMITSQKYYRGENTKILNRLQWFYNASGNLEQDKFKANNQTPSEFYPKIIKQENSYLLSNGVTIDDKIKDKLPKDCDNKIFKGGSYALIDGVAYIYPFIDEKGFNFEVFRGSELIPLTDDKTGRILGAIRFYKPSSTNITYIDLYEVDGKTELEIQGKNIVITKEKESYINKVFKSNIETIFLEGKNFKELPIIPLYGNELKRTSLTVALKNKIDLYDIIMSDFGNNLEDCQDVYWVIKNYSGQDLGEFLEDYKLYKSIKVDNEGDAKAHTIEVPFQARETALTLIRKGIYEGAMALDTSVLSGGSITNIVIKAMMCDLDLKTDIFEMNVLDALNKLIDFYMDYTGTNEEYHIKLIRRGLVNDTEVIENLLKMRQDISLETFLELNPYIENVQNEMDRIDKDATKVYSNSGGEQAY